MEENRSNGRRRTVKAGKVILNKMSVMDCQIRDLSGTGARLEFTGPTALPPEFKLRIVSLGIEVPVELVWQRSLSAGVRFDMAPGTF